MAEREDKDDIGIDLLCDTEECIIVIGQSRRDLGAVLHLVSLLRTTPNVTRVTGTVIILKTVRMQRASLVAILTPSKTGPVLPQPTHRALLVNIESAAN